MVNSPWRNFQNLKGPHAWSRTGEGRPARNSSSWRSPSVEVRDNRPRKRAMTCSYENSDQAVTPVSVVTTAGLARSHGLTRRDGGEHGRASEEEWRVVEVISVSCSRVLGISSSLDRRRLIS